MSVRIARIIASATSVVLALGLSVAAGAPASAAPRSGAPAPTAAQQVIPLRAAPELMPAKNHSCGWGIKTKYHSCDLAQALIWWYEDLGEPATLYDVYSPHSGRYYDFNCWGGNYVTCRSYKGRVTFYLSRLPGAQACGTDNYGNDVVAWMAANCDFALNTANAWEDSGNGRVRGIYEPADDRYYSMYCYGSAPTICYNNKDWVIIRA